MLTKKTLAEHRDLTIPLSVNTAFIMQPLEYQAVAAFREIKDTPTLILTLYKRDAKTPIMRLYQTETEYATERYYFQKCDRSTNYRQVWVEELKYSKAFLEKILPCAWNNLGFVGEESLRALEMATFIARKEGSQRVQDYILGIYRLQSSILYARQNAKKEREWAKTKKLMDMIPAIPQTFTESARRDAFTSSYVFMTNKDRKGARIGSCARCGHTFTVKGSVKHKDKGKCPHCGKDVTYLRAKTHGELSDHAGYALVQRIPHTENLCIRSFWVQRIFGRGEYAYGKEHLYIRERYRTFVEKDMDGNTVKSTTYADTQGSIIPWRMRSGNSFSLIEKTYRSISFPIIRWPDDNNVYKRNLKSVIKSSVLRYSGIDLFLRNNYSDSLAFLPDIVSLYRKMPETEMLLKLGLYQVYGMVLFNIERQDGLHGLYADKNDTALKPFLPQYRKDIIQDGRKIDNKMFLTMKRLSDKGLYLPLRDIQKLSRYAGKDSAATSKVIEHILFLPMMTSAKIMRIVKYLDKQNALIKAKAEREGRKDNRKVENDWCDYINECIVLNRDLSDASIIMPFNLQEEHEYASMQVDPVQELAREAEFLKAMQGVYDSIAKAIAKEKESGLTVVIPGSIRDMLLEGRNNRNCVGGYGKRVADGSSLVIFIRNTEDVSKPFCTVELDPTDGEVLQCRAKCNATAPDNVMQYAERIGKAYAKEAKRVA